VAEEAQNRVSAGTSSDVRTFVVAALLTYASGMLAFVGYAMLGGSGGGIILGLIAAFFAVLCWRSTQDRKIFPRDPSTRSVIILALFAAVLTVIAVALTS
jgi:membrane associated rhomboid family serine protease